MKIRNKKTGRVYTLRQMIIDEPWKEDKTHYDSLKEFMEDWEDAEEIDEYNNYKATIEIKGPKKEVQTFLDRCRAAEYMSDFDDSKITILTEGEV